MSALQSRHLMQLTIPYPRDNAEWKRIHDEKPKLESFSPSYTVWATKKGKPGLLGTSWNKRFWALVGNFLIYFDSDGSSQKAGGAIYLVHCKLEQSKEDDGHEHIVSFKPLVPRRPGMAITDESNEWILSFDSAKDAQKTLEVVREAAAPKDSLAAAPTATTYK